MLVVVTVDQAFIDGAEVLEEYDAGSASFTHAAALVGYRPNGFLVRCSWGDDWGGTVTRLRRVLSRARGDRELRHRGLTQRRGDPRQVEIAGQRQAAVAQRVRSRR